ncbi:hypothetical protein ACWEQL_26735 [Kitasatospora sp. NPDC004240]
MISPFPAPDPRARNLAQDFEGMDALVADLVLPAGASMSVMSTLETSRELIRHSYHRYEFATVAVSHSLLALEHAITERLAVQGPLGELLRRATDAGLLPAGLAAELDRARLLRDRLGQGTATSAALLPLGAVVLVRAVFDAVTLLLRLPAAEGTAEDGPGAEKPADRLARLWEEYRQAAYPPSFRGVDIDGVELILLDADMAAVVQRELRSGLDDDGVALLWRCIADLDKAVPLIQEAYCASYFGRLRTVAGLVAARHLPEAT